MSMQDPWSPSTPPAPPTAPDTGMGGGGPAGPMGGGPAGPGGTPPPGAPNRTPIIAGVAGLVAVIVIVVVVLLLVGGGKKKASNVTPTTNSPATSAAPGSTAPATSAPPNTGTGSGSNSLLDSVPSSFRSDCQASQESDFVDTSASEQVLCAGSSLPSAQGIVYIRYSSKNGSENYYSTTLLGGNGMQSGQGACGTLELQGSATNGSYCETDVSDQQGGPTTGHQFVFTGSKFDVGSGNDLSSVCSSSSSGFTVVGWTDDPTDLTALAISCTNDVSTAKAMESHYLHSDYDLSS